MGPGPTVLSVEVESSLRVTFIPGIYEISLPRIDLLLEVNMDDPEKWAKVTCTKVEPLPLEAAVNTLFDVTRFRELLQSSFTWSMQVIEADTRRTVISTNVLLPLANLGDIFSACFRKLLKEQNKKMEGMFAMGRLFRALSRDLAGSTGVAAND